jgi:hypothetical protein
MTGARWWGVGGGTMILYVLRMLALAYGDAALDEPPLFA